MPQQFFGFEYLRIEASVKVVFRIVKKSSTFRAARNLGLPRNPEPTPWQDSMSNQLRHLNTLNSTTF